jgi:imidazolonepropionase-like amidohydrolase
MDLPAMAKTAKMERRRLTTVRARWLFDGTSAVVHANPVVVLDGPTITAVDYGIAPPDKADLVDFDGATPLPGQIDTRVHLPFDASRDPVASLAARDDTDALAAMTTAARRAKRRSHHHPRPRRPQLPVPATARHRGPSHHRHGRSADQHARGHCHFLGGDAEPGAEGVRAVAREHAKRGVDVIELVASGGIMTPGAREDRALFNADALRSAVGEAHQRRPRSRRGDADAAPGSARFSDRRRISR